MKAKTFYLMVGLGLFSAQLLGGQVIYGEEISNVGTNEVIPDLPNNPDLPQETENPTINKGTSVDNHEGDKPTGTTGTVDTGATDKIGHEENESGNTGQVIPDLPNTGGDSTDSSVNHTEPDQETQNSLSGNESTSTTESTTNKETPSKEETNKEETNKETDAPKKTENSSNASVSIPTTTTPVVQNVKVTPNGTIAKPNEAGQSTAIETANVAELTHIPTPSTPLMAENGQKIVGVKDGVPLVQTDSGSLIPATGITVKKLPSGNIEVKDEKGEVKVLPKTGEKRSFLVSLFGIGLLGATGLSALLLKKYLKM